MSGPVSTLYEGETYRLQFKFGMTYPFDSPEVVFVGDSIPVHQHIYSNGHICLSILTDDWSPALSVESVCLSIISMLASAKDKVRPSDDGFYVKTCSKNPKKTRWWYHDDSVWSEDYLAEDYLAEDYLAEDYLAEMIKSSQRQELQKCFKSTYFFYT